MKHIYKTLTLILCLICVATSLPRPVAAQSALGSGGPVTLRLEHIYIEDLTNPETDPDDPYFIVIKFRSRFFTTGSTQVIVCGKTENFNQDDPLCVKPEDKLDLGNNEGAAIPVEIGGGATFVNVHYSTLDSVAHGDFPEIIGVAIVAVENDHSIDEVLDAAQAKAQAIRDKLFAEVEQGNAVNNFFKSSDGGADNGEEAIKVLGTGCGGEGLQQDVPSNDLDTGVWGPLTGGVLGWGLAGHPIGGLAALVGEDFINALVDFYADDPVDLRVIAYLTMENSALAERCSDININNEKRAFLTVLPQGALNECPPDTARCQRFAIDEGDPIKFVGQDGEWHVTLSVTADAPVSAVTAPPYMRRHAPITSRLYLPVITHESGDDQPMTAVTTTMFLRTLQYNVQFLTPWNKGVVEKGHWPNTAERALAVGEALACYDLVALNESVNDTRRKEIIDAMRASAPYCGRPNLLLGESYFTYVSGPRVEDAHINDPKPALEALTSTRTYIDFVNGRPAQPLVGDELTIISRFPIVESHTYIYQSAYGIDALAAKGVLHARLQVGDAAAREFVDVFATHLQAGSNEVKTAQITELGDFMVDHAESDIPIMLLGDFNVAGPFVGRPLEPMAEQPLYNHLMNMLTTLASTHVLQDSGLGLPTGTSQTKDENNQRIDRIDHILLTPSRLKFNPSDMQVKEFDGNGWGTLSDHIGVEANLRWEKTTYVPTVGKPDLIVEDVRVTSEGIQVTIKNIGNASVLPGNNFWVDMYINPRTPPTTVNQVWQDMGDYGLVWGVVSSALPLPPGAQIILDLNDPYFTDSRSLYPNEIPAGSQIFVQVDSANSRTGYGGVLESHEETGQAYNNLISFTLQETVSTQQWSSITAAESDTTHSAAQNVLLTTPRQ